MMGDYIACWYEVYTQIVGLHFLHILADREITWGQAKNRIGLMADQSSKLRENGQSRCSFETQIYLTGKDDT